MSFLARPPSRVEFWLGGILFLVVIVLTIRVFFYRTPIDDIDDLKSKTLIIEMKQEMTEKTQEMQNKTQARFEELFLEVVKTHGAWQEVRLMRERNLVNERKKVRRRKR